MKKKWEDEEYRRKATEQNKKRWEDLLYKEKMINAYKNRWKDEEYRKNHSDKMIEKWKDEEYREDVTKAIKIGTNSKSCIKKHKQITKKFWTQKNRERFGKQIKEKWAVEEYRKKQTDERIERWKDEEYRKNHSDKMIEKWKDEEYANKHFKSTTNYKELTLPSGRVVKLQGYEPQVLEQLLTEYNEHDIYCEVKSINNELGKILYNFEGKERRYYPDFYIKSTNTIIEVKSQWTFDKWKEKNLAKEQACLQQGFNFEFMIIK